QNQGTVKTLEEIMVVLLRRMKAPDGPGEYDYILNMEMYRLICQCIKFDPENTKKFDAVMAWGFYELLYESVMGWMKNKGNAPPANESRALFNLLTGSKLGE